YRALMDGAGDAILLTDLQGNLLEANHRAEELLGYTRTELSSMHFTQLHLPEDVSDLVDAFNQLANQQISQVLDVRFRCRDGSVVPVDITASMIEIHGEKIVQGILRDIRDRKQAELALRESEEKFRQLAEVVEAVFWILPLSRTERVYVSPAYERIWGKPCQELYISVDSWDNAIHPLDRDRIVAAIPKQLRGEYDEEYRIIRPDGEIRWIRDRAFPIKNSQGEVYRIAGIAEDITTHKQTEHQIQQQMERERLLREISQRIRQSLDLQSIFDTACQEIRQVLQADRVGIFKFYPESRHDDGEFVAEAVVNDVSSVLAIRVHDHCFGKNYSLLYAQGKYFVVDDIYCNGLESCHTSILTQFQVRANMVMPLLCGNELWGLLCIHQCRTPRQWQPSEIDLGQ
ncbi:MAG TPA: PAS domain S-box protein, partial [Allocoleopsis sp.]